MRLRASLAFFAVTLLAAGGCGDDEHSHDTHDSGDGGSCPHLGTVVECDAEIDTIGASASLDGTTIEVTEATPEMPMAGEGDGNTLMVKISDADGNPVSGAELDDVFTLAHGGHAPCGSPQLMEMDGGMYHVHGLIYPHGGTWHHAFVVDGQEIDLEICVMNEHGAGGDAGAHDGHGG